ncbi:MAG: hypothetical protein AAGJ34_11105 [Pseudomonadota bacterium]
MTPRTKWIITILMAATIFRAQTLLFLPTIEAFGGIAPNAWFGPWLSDAIIGLLLPLMLYVLWLGTSTRAWGALVVYNALGAFDYSHGLMTQYFHPMPVEMASPMTVYVGIGVFMVLQLIALAILFQRRVADGFST